MKLTPRLKTIADLVPKGTIVGDVGSDHGYVPIYLVENDICERAIASDINEGPTENARQAVSEADLTEKIDVRHGGGLLPYEVGEIETVIIAGMGGLLIRDILLERPEMTESIKTFVLQPMVAQDELRMWLSQNGFKIVDEKLSQEAHRMYEILVVEHGQMTIEDPLSYEIGIKLLKENDPLSQVFIDKKIKQTSEIIRGLEASKTPEVKVKLPELKEKLVRLEGIRKCL
ncbi:tRNA (adenine(22)-N(1))-methyltransferase [Fusibacter sp. JL216-2]|uniref:tRNA (adenine(22)-N(1))-methyltransferase n=1 Tax=Fusibacter sp. JL216-2 TaxID=3071453 RepID=UPI003D34F3A4